MRLYLINPQNPLVMKKIKAERFHRYRIWKPLGLLAVAALTGDDWEISILDENLGAVDFTALPAPDLVGITAFTSQANRAYEIAAAFRARGVPVVMGGIHASMCPEEARAHVDAVVIGEAEGAWPQVLEDARRGKLAPTYTSDFVDIENVPAARHDLLPEGYAFGSIQTTRGCPLNCNFCSVTAFNGSQYRHRSIPTVVREFAAIREKQILVVDDNLIGTSKRHIERARRSSGR